VVNKEVEQEFLGRGMTLNKRNLHSYFSELKQLRKSSYAAFCLLLSSAAGAMPNSACRSLTTTVIMSSSHWLLIICSPQLTLYPLVLRAHLFPFFHAITSKLDIILFSLLFFVVFGRERQRKGPGFQTILQGHTPATQNFHLVPVFHHYTTFH
jgi:hypothetical protein